MAAVVPEVSVIVPVYGVEAYLDECVASIAKALPATGEIVLVDDASPDGCPAICDRWAQADARIRVIHQPRNLGVAQARNAGIDASRAPLLMFADGDDRVKPNFCTRAMGVLAETGADMVAFNPERIDPTGNHLDTDWTFRLGCEGSLTRDEALIALAEERMYDFVWNKIYRRELFDQERFGDQVLWEDMDLCYRLVAHCSLVYAIPDELYEYRERPGSLIMEDIVPAAYGMARVRDDAVRWVMEHCPGPAVVPLTRRSVEEDLRFLHLAAGKPEWRERFDEVRERVLARDTAGMDLGKRQRTSLGLLRVSPALFAIAVQAWRAARGRG